MLHIGFFAVLLATFSTAQDTEALLNGTQLFNVTYEISDDPQELYAIYESYYPLICLINSLDANETRRLEKYLKKRTYAELKRMIDAKLINESDIINEVINSEEGSGLAAPLEEMGELVGSRNMDYIQAYHNATVYSIVRAIWNTELGQTLPPFDQIAILEYFAEKRSEELLRENIIQRIWRVIRRFFHQDVDDPEMVEKQGCEAEKPMCVRRLVAGLTVEERARLAEMLAAETEDAVTRDLEARRFIESRLDSEAENELRAWTASIAALPEPLLHILDNATNAEKRGLQRLREKELLHAMKDYYRSMIERKKPQEQEMIRQFFQRMNETFARCYNPMKKKYELWSDDDSSEEEF